jgi:hypothetical protein
MAKQRSKHRYSDSERAQALAILDANGGNMARAARQAKVPRCTLQQWAKGRVSADVPKLQQEKNADLADLFEKAAHEMIGVAMANKDGLASDRAMVAAGIATDKALLLRGKATAITQEIKHDTLTDEDLDQRIAELEGRIPRPSGGAGPASGPAKP